jgi:hypothetical protein
MADRIMADMDQQERFLLVDPPDGIGIVIQEFVPESGFDFKAAGADTILQLRRVSLVQLAFVHQAVRDAGGLAGRSHNEVTEIVLGETAPLWASVLRPASYRLNGRAANGVVLPYRGIEFLMTTFETEVRWDFACWRLPEVPPDTPWPPVTEA